MCDIKSTDKKYIANTYARFDLQIVSGKGSLVYDEQGREYIDLGTGIAVNTLGISDDEWVSAVTRQLKKCQHTSNLYYSEPGIALAKELCKRTGAKKVFFSNSGAEANECMIKVIRKWALENKGEGYHNIITLKNSFHGRTVTTLAATGQDSFHTVFSPFTEGFIYCEANDCEQLESLAANNNCAAVMIEIVQGEGGVMPLTEEFIKAVTRVAKKHNMLIAVDEVQTGNGRSGKLYAYQNYDIKPDVVSTAKGLAGGLPIGATMMFDKTENTLTPGTHGSTFGSNPVSCAAALHVLSRLDDKLLSQVSEKSEYIKSELNNTPGVKSVSGLGLMLGIETERDASEVIKYCMDNGVLAIKAKNKVRLLPALNIPMELLKRAVSVIKEAVKVN